MPLEFHEVKSSNLKAVAQQGDDLLVRFKNGGLFRYKGAGGHYADLIAAPSAGSYFANIVKKQYAFEAARLDEE